MAFQRKFEWTVLLLQLIFILGFAFLVEYGDDLDATNPKHNSIEAEGGQDPKENSLHAYYPMFQDINVMVFLGIGCLYAFIQKYSYSGLGMNFLLCAITVQLAIFTQNLWHLENGKIKITVYRLVKGEFAAASAVIALGGIFGKVCPLQMVAFSVLEVILYSVLRYVCEVHIQVTDVGESVGLHLFAAIFGCAAAYVIDRNVDVQNNPNDRPSYNSNIFCIIGTLLLWVFWPSFNAASDRGHDRHRNVMNTYLALLGSAITAFAASALLSKNNKFTMSHIQNSSLAGAVGVGTTSNLMIQPFGALLIGSVSGIISVAGFLYVSPFLAKIKVYDPCGINSLHGIPGLMAGISGIFVAMTANEARYGYNLYKLYPAMAPEINTTALMEIQRHSPDVNAGVNRSAEYQALYQLLYIFLVIISSLLGGLITGFILQLDMFGPLETKEMYLDEVFWNVPHSEEKENGANSRGLNNSSLKENDAT